MLYDKSSHEPEFLGEAFPTIAKAMCQADCKTYEPLKSVHQFC